MSWLEQVNDRGPWDVALALELQRCDRTHLGPCPACQGEQRSRTDRRRGPIFLVGKRGWKCGLCGASGDAIRLAAWVLLGAELVKGDPRWRELWDACASRGWCTPRPAARERATWKPAPPPVPPPAEDPPNRVDPDELTELWDACVSVNEDEQVADWLQSRGLTPATVADRDLARALPRDARAPRWARHRMHPWTLGWRCLLPTWGATGEMESIRARWVRNTADVPEGCMRSGAAAAGPGSASGMVLACGLARQVLAGGMVPAWWPLGVPLQVVVVEGEPDWLTWATRWADNATAPAVLGIWNGSWCDEIAARIPDGAQVCVRVHHDEAGDRYATRIARTLWGRCVVRRSKPKGRTDVAAA